MRYIPKGNLRLDPSITDGVILRYLSALDCPRSLTAWLMYKHGEHDQLANLVCNPLDHDSIVTFRPAYLATQFLRKADFLKVKIDPKVVALERFEASEAKCKDTNTRWLLRSFENSDWNAIHRVARKIESIIGPGPNIDRWLDLSAWGPGATLSVRRRDASSFKKFRDERGITIDAAFLIPLMDAAYPHFMGRLYQYELGDRIVVVPKDATKDRVILIQPGWNLWLQKGLGKLLRLKLRSSGLDIDEGASEYNQWAAEYASKNGMLATIDFASASDSIAIEPLREVLPPGWFKVLDYLRSKRSNDGRVWEKFSSMGNGFTFELETLLFYAIACVSCETAGISEKTVSVFGDDVIVPIAAVSPFYRLSETFGFTVNRNKSFDSTCFRESCGAHYYDGVDCKPVFLKKKISDVVAAYKTHNQIRWLAHRMSGRMSCDACFLPVCKFIVRSLPVYFRRFRSSYGFGEIGLVSNFDEACPSKAKHGWQGYYFKSLVARTMSYATEELSLLWVRLTEHSDLDRQNNVSLKDRTKVSLQHTYASEWYDLGPWI